MQTFHDRSPTVHLCLADPQGRLRSVRAVNIHILPKEGAVRRTRSTTMLAALAAGALLLGACSENSPDSGVDAGGDNGGDNGGVALSGDIRIDGSSTVTPLITLAAEDFQTANSGVRVTVATSGTGGGFEKFCNGETDISMASRAIKDEEVEACAGNDIEPMEMIVANDGLSVVVHPDNDWAECLSVEQLNAIWAPDSTIDNWNQVDESFPDVPLTLYGAGSDSGTFDYFTDAINGEEGATRTDYNPSEDDNVTVTGVAGEEGAMGYFGLSYLLENSDKIKGVEIDGGEGCVAASNETVQSGEYTPLGRSLYVYTKAEAAARPEVQAFLQYYLDNAEAITSEALFVPLTDEQVTKATAELEAIANA
jgi:phosphate transport system substrate-binding protein